MLQIHVFFLKQKTSYEVRISDWSSDVCSSDLVERFFAELTEKQIRRGVHRSTRQLEAAIKAYIDTVNAQPKPFKWTKSADDILASVKRFCLATLKTADSQAKIARTSESGH